MIHYDIVRSDADLQQILDLQAKNLPSHISLEEKKAEGFVTIHHDFKLLAAMNQPYPHVVARQNGQIVGYTLVMQRDFATAIPYLQPMFKMIDQQRYRGQLLADAAYFVMGQVCIEKDYRGQGLFQKLYEKLKDGLVAHFDLVITEVSLKNPRSIRAHEKVGFKNIKTYATDDGEEWMILLWDWRL